MLAAGGAGPEHMVRMSWSIVDLAEYNARLRELDEAYRAVMSKRFPAMNCLEVSAPVEERAKVEIEVAAGLPD